MASFVNFNLVPTGINLHSSGITGSTLSNITIFGLALLIFYSITKILNFYGIGINVYGSYLAFYVFLLIAAFTLNRHYPLF